MWTGRSIECHFLSGHRCFYALFLSTEMAAIHSRLCRVYISTAHISNMIHHPLHRMRIDHIFPPTPLILCDTRIANLAARDSIVRHVIDTHLFCNDVHVLSDHEFPQPLAGQLLCVFHDLYRVVRLRLCLFRETSDGSHHHEAL